MPSARDDDTKTTEERTSAVIFPAYYACARERDYKISGFFCGN